VTIGFLDALSFFVYLYLTPFVFLIYLPDNFYTFVPYTMCGMAIRILKCNAGVVPRDIRVIGALPGTGRKTASLAMTECHDEEVLITGDRHVGVGAVAIWKLPVQGRRFNADRISRYVEGFIDQKSNLRRMMNSAFGGIKQFYNYENNPTRREEARKALLDVAREKKCYKMIKLLATCQKSDYFDIPRKSSAKETKAQQQMRKERTKQKGSN